MSTSRLPAPLGPRVATGDVLAASVVEAARSAAPQAPIVSDIVASAHASREAAPVGEAVL